jgi:hypothetical protein
MVVVVVVAVAPADLLMPPWPLQAPRPPLEDVPSLQVTMVVPLVLVAAAVGAAAAAAGAAAGAAAPPADLLMPPWPLQAPRPPLEDVPSLQVTMADPPLALLAAAVEAAAGAAAGGAAALPADLLTPPWPLQAPRPPLEVVPSLQVTVAEPLLVELAAAGAAGAGAAELVLLVPLLLLVPADLLMPPCPLQAPRPPLEVVPSLQVTVLAVSCAAQIAGAASSAPANKTPTMRCRTCRTFICSAPRERPLVLGGSE